MADQTSHYGLIKPTYDEHADVEVLNENMDTIDEQIYAANTSVRAVNRGGTGAATAAEARTNLGLGDVLDDVDELKDSLKSAKFLFKTIPANGSATYTFSTTCAFVVFGGGSIAATRFIYFGYCTASGTVSGTKLDIANNTVVSVETSPYTLTFNTTNNYSIYTSFFKISGTMPT